MTNHHIKKYLKQVKILLPIYSKQEKRFLKDLKNDIIEYSNTNSETTLEDLINEFGSPNVVVHDYIESVDLDYIIKRISVRKVVSRGVVIILLLAFIGFSAFIGSVYSAYIHSLDSVITQEVTVIE